MLLRLSFVDGQVSLWIEDDGQGFEPDSVLAPAGGRKAWGLVGMQERASLVGGQFDIMSAPGRGTVVTVIVPVEET